MIRRLRGRIVDRTAGSIVLDVHGVGYLVTVPKSAQFELDAEVSLHIYTHVREDILALFGFIDPTGLTLFEYLITVPTIGPVKAMGILETPPAELIALVRAKDARRLATLPGVGKKTAERIVIDLFDKLEALGTPSLRPLVPSTGLPTLVLDLVSALTNLGFRPQVAEESARAAIEKLGKSAKLEDLLREALAQRRPPV
ncbi:MAG: Holliday junction branch migration protein RuvA [Deltaproteobacteria bacterium]|nr:Holliday junction branch migration protein RuvA [Deltaproteobacteria bacterium]